MRRKISVTLSLVIALASLAAPVRGQFVYVANQSSNNVSGYTIDATGALTAISGSPFAAGLGSSGVVLDPTGKFAYVANYFGSTVSGYTIDGTTGALTAISGSPFATASGPFSIALDPTGKFAFVASTNFFGTVPGSVSGYTIDATTGALTAINGSPFAAGMGPNGLAVDPTGKFAYVANFSSDDVSGFAINATTGALTAISGSPFAAGSGPFSVAVDPTGKFAYVTNFSSGSVSGYAIDATTGALTAISGSPFVTGVGPEGVAVDPAGKFAYVANFFSNNVSGFVINGTTGALTAISGSPFIAGAEPDRGVAVDPTGKFAYVTNANFFGTVPGSVSGYTIDATTGALMAISGSPFAAGGGPIGMAVSKVKQNLVPTITSISPTSAVAGGAAFTLTVNGTNFVNGSTVNFIGNALATTFVSATQLAAVVPASDIATAGSFNVTVINPGGGTSNDVSFTVVTPQDATQAIISSVNVLFGQGVINGGQDNSLLAQLQHAITMMNAGKNAGAIGNLDSFISEVNDLLASGVLSPAQAAALVNAAQSVIAALSQRHSSAPSSRP